uniref:Transmembrane protein n=1 Tax=Moniliophthora roreri TaxID=221103 RepID=A0A0W0GCL8_MONRR
MASCTHRIDDASPLISYQPEGAWSLKVPLNDILAPSYHEQSRTVTWSPNATASFSFNGTRVTIYGGTSNIYGDFTVALDGTQYEQSAYSPEQAYNVTLFTRDNLKQEHHTLVITNRVTDDRWTGLDIDSIEWTSKITVGNDDDQDPWHRRFQDTGEEFSWAPKGMWNTSPKNVEMFEDGTGHSTSYPGASVNFTFTGKTTDVALTWSQAQPFLMSGIAVSLYGTIGPSNSRSYTVQVDNETPQVYSAYRDIWAPRQMLFNADNLGPGSHSVVICNGKCSDLSSRQDDQGLLELDFARVWAVNITISTPTSTSTSIPAESRVPTGNGGEGGNRLPPAAIAGIAIASTISVILLFALWLLNRRNKALWMRLNNGYMVQSQLDIHTPPGNRSPLIMGSAGDLVPGSSTAVNPDSSSAANRSGNTLPHLYQSGPLISEGTTISTPAASIATKYTPYSGFGRDRSSSKASASSHGLSIQTASTSQVGNPYPDAVLAARIGTGTSRGGNGPPQRSGTLETTSTLVAENGSMVTTSDTISVAKRLSLMGRRRNTPPTPAPTLATVSSSTSGSRGRRSRPYRRSSSPSSARLLPNQELPLSSEGSEDEAGGADFYVSEAHLANYTPVSPRSLARTQSDIIRTPVQTRLDSVRTASIPTTLPTPIEAVEEEQRQSALVNQLQLRYQRQLQSETGHDGQNQDEANDGAGTDVEVPSWISSGTASLMESPPPAYSSNRPSLALASRAGSRDNTG